MIKTTQEFNDLILSNKRELKMKVIFNGRQEIDGRYLKNVSIHEVSNGGDVLTLGTICSNSVKISMYNPGNVAFVNSYVEIFIGLNVVNNVEWVCMGTYIISEVNKENDYEVSLGGYDYASLLNVDYVPHIVYPALLKDVVDDIAMQCHIQVKEDVLEDIMIDAPMEVTCKEMLGYMASLMGKNARINRYNKLEFFWYSDENYCISKKHQFEDSFKKTNSELCITSLTSGSEENVFVSGSGYGMNFMNPYMTQERLDLLLEIFNGFSYVPCSLKWRGNPCIEVNDILSVEESTDKYIKCIVFESIYNFDGGLSDSIECKGQNEKEVVMSKSPTEIKLKKMYHSLIQSYKEITEKILGHKGGYYVIDNDEEGYPSGWTIMDTPSLRDDTHLWKMSMGGFGYSEDGGKTYKNFAFDLSGNFTANVISTGILKGEKFELNLDTGFIRIGNRNSQGIIDDVYFSYDQDGLYLRTIGEMSDRIDKNASQISQLNLNLQGIETLVRQVQETLVSVKNYFINLSLLKPIIDEESSNGYEIKDNSLILITAQSGSYELFWSHNIIDSFSKDKVYSTAIDMNLLSDNKDDTYTIHLTSGNKTTDFTLTCDNTRFLLEDISFVDNETYRLSIDDGNKNIAITRLDLVEGDRYVESKIGLQEMSTQINQSESTIEFVKNGLDQVIDELGNYVTQKSLNEFIRFDGAKITLGVSDSSFSTVITNTKMSFYDGNIEVAYISNNALHIEDAVINHSFAIGCFSWQPRRNGNLSLLKVK